MTATPISGQICDNAFLPRKCLGITALLKAALSMWSPRETRLRICSVATCKRRRTTRQWSHPLTAYWTWKLGKRHLKNKYFERNHRLCEPTVHKYTMRFVNVGQAAVLDISNAEVESDRTLRAESSYWQSGSSKIGPRTCQYKRHSSSGSHVDNANISPSLARSFRNSLQQNAPQCVNIVGSG